MKFCSTCGKEAHDSAVVCLGCGCSLNNISYDDPPNFGYALLGFLIPVAGLVLYCVWKDSKPLTAKSAGKGAIASIIAGVVMYIFMFVFMFGIALI